MKAIIISAVLSIWSGAVFAALSATLVKKVGLNLTYTGKDSSNVPVGTQRTDTFTAITLQYAF